MVNVQLCTFKLFTSFLVKYVTKISQKASVYFTRNESEYCSIDVQNDRPNSKKSSGKGKNCKGDSHIREVGLIEMIWKLLELSFVFTNVEFVHYSSQAPELRFCVKKTYMKQNVCVDGSLKIIDERSQLPMWPRFTSSQVLMVRQLICSEFFLDRV